MMRILIVGCGDVGLRAARLLAGHARLYGLIRSPERAEALRAVGVTPLFGDLDDRASLKRLAGLADVVLHFAPPPAQGERDPRTRRLLAALGRGSLSQLIYISTSGVYGDCGGEVVSETRPARPNNPRAHRRADAEAQLRRFGMRATQVSLLRAPGIYAQNRMPEERVKKALPAIVSADDVHTNHIHADDLARLAIATLFHGRRNRLYNAVDDSGLKMGDWFDVVADHLGLPRPPRLPREQVIAAVTPAMRTFLTESRRLSNRRIKKELRFRLRYPTVREGLRGWEPS
ncbi:MAG: SDR family oxidoreductase [Pseudomonadota bacterium]|nr:SDR family oxidoreductase [Pseudomonadota bacterium]MDP1905776.1 SDR family oxidoreductase [Pseudomonadota bacterium]MDP2354006.1 SDR family oxidoreductase [Pseudomonadota bacterium]